MEPDRTSTSKVVRWTTKATDEQRAVMSDELIATLGLSPRLARLLSAVHEAGHAVVADTVGATVTGITVRGGAGLGLGGDVTHLHMPEAEEIPLPEHLVILGAGFQASYMWVGGRGLLATVGKPAMNKALSTLAAGDISALDDLRERWDRPDVRMQDGMITAAKILYRRWRTVLRLGHDLARLGTLEQAEVSARLSTTPASNSREARSTFEGWRAEFETKVGGDTA